jgi:hypothetical protein
MLKNKVCSISLLVSKFDISCVLGKFLPFKNVLSKEINKLKYLASIRNFLPENVLPSRERLAPNQGSKLSTVRKEHKSPEPRGSDKGSAHIYTDRAAEQIRSGR